METLKISPNWNGVDAQVREMETNSLLELYDMMAENPTPFQLVSDELLFRARTEQKLEHSEQISEIRKRF